ncbi:hypothetical protein SAMN05192560_0813 [Methylobacillus rhizosphaerae]|uniref:UPF0125 protein SAMN05192560_0813 n=1 Tax=Methylobacillus rhizosphaerae TaxID=551994 RepID=A0A238YST6_9PROT|nr:RnfH family protein [Methylobacillus rhizosphaerae]SNR74187.1 hypothetical protein SAMN05192560_0813 [Methylobacillus rhizosphaerae]
MTTRIPVEVAHALPEKQMILKIEVAPGTTALQAVLQSGISDHFPGLDTNQLGIFGEVVQTDHILQAQDRVEIYRPLLADPKEARRKRASRDAAPRKGARKTTPSVAVRTR